MSAHPSPSQHVPFHLFARLAPRPGIKVLLTGEGADELFHGYGTMIMAMGRRAFRGVGASVRSLLRRTPVARSLLGFLTEPDELPANLLRRGYEQALREEVREVCGS